MKHFPLFIDINDKTILVVGGGKIASRRIATLLQFGCKILVIAPELCDDLKQLTEQGIIDWEPVFWEVNNHKPECNDQVLSSTTLEYTDFKNFFMVLGCTDCRDVNHDIYTKAKAAGILVNVCDCKEECDFYFPAVIQSGDVTVGLTANGTDHKLARRTADKIRALLKRNEHL